MKSMDAPEPGLCIVSFEIWARVSGGLQGLRCTCRHLVHDELGRILRIPLVKDNKYRLR